jgi:hypothetical protein
VDPEVAQIVEDRAFHSIVEMQARVAWAWYNKQVRTVHINRGANWATLPLGIQVSGRAVA